MIDPSLGGTAVAAVDPPQGRPVLTVDLQAIVDNHRTLRARFRGRELTAVIKSDAYGLGAIPVMRALTKAGCKTFWVNDLNEGAALKTRFPTATVLALQGLGVDPIEGFRAGGVVPVLASLGEVEHAARHARATGEPLPVSIQLDTGLGRLGLPACEVERLVAAPDRLDGLSLHSWVTHLAAFDRPDDPLNAQQRGQFRDWTDKLPSAALSLAASACVFRDAAWHFDIARVGSAHFGVQTSTRWQGGLTPVYRLSAPVLRLVDLPADRTVGYRGAGVLRRATRVATLDIGYANGLPPAWVTSGYAIVAGHRAPFIGGASMSLTMLDVTDLPEGVVGVGTRCTLFDAANPVEPVAQALGMAPNALLTQIAGTTTRHYLPTDEANARPTDQADKVATA